MSWRNADTMPEEPGPYAKRLWIIAYFPEISWPNTSRDVVMGCTPYFARLWNATKWQPMPDGPDALG